MPLPIEKSQGSVNNLIKRFQQASDHSLRQQEREREKGSSVGSISRHSTGNASVPNILLPPASSDLGVGKPPWKVKLEESRRASEGVSGWLQKGQMGKEEEGEVMEELLDAPIPAAAPIAPAVSSVKPPPSSATTTTPTPQAKATSPTKEKGTPSRPTPAPAPAATKGPSDPSRLAGKTKASTSAVGVAKPVTTKLVITKPKSSEPIKATPRTAAISSSSAPPAKSAPKSSILPKPALTAPKPSSSTIPKPPLPSTTTLPRTRKPSLPTPAPVPLRAQRTGPPTTRPLIPSRTGGAPTIPSLQPNPAPLLPHHTGTPAIPRSALYAPTASSLAKARDREELMRAKEETAGKRVRSGSGEKVGGRVVSGGGSLGRSAGATVVKKTVPTTKPVAKAPVKPTPAPAPNTSSLGRSSASGSIGRSTISSAGGSLTRAGGGGAAGVVKRGARVGLAGAGLMGGVAKVKGMGREEKGEEKMEADGKEVKEDEVEVLEEEKNVVEDEEMPPADGADLSHEEEVEEPASEPEHPSEAVEDVETAEDVPEEDGIPDDLPSPVESEVVGVPESDLHLAEVEGKEEEIDGGEIQGEKQEAEQAEDGREVEVEAEKQEEAAMVGEAQEVFVGDQVVHEEEDAQVEADEEKVVEARPKDQILEDTPSESHPASPKETSQSSLQQAEASLHRQVAEIEVEEVEEQPVMSGKDEHEMTMLTTAHE